VGKGEDVQDRTYWTPPEVSGDHGRKELKPMLLKPEPKSTYQIYVGGKRETKGKSPTSVHVYSTSRRDLGLTRQGRADARLQRSVLKKKKVS